MPEIKFYNTLTRKKEEFKPLRKNRVGIYSCGPTVYWNQHIGHMYAYVQWDILVRFLRYAGYKVKWVMNITDVGHLTSDEDEGEDKMEKGARRENLTVWQIADKYIKQFEESLEMLNIQKPDKLVRATDHIAEQIDLIKKIEKNGFVYKTKTGIVFDTSKFSQYSQFAKLNLQKQKSGSRVEVDIEKKNPWDFLLWITNQPKHIMQWESPWGKGFPGWHIECTAMSTKYLGNKFDIHTGGKEHIPGHHTNEIAQSYGAFGQQTANYWLHNEWLVIDGEKMSKSLGNMVLTSDLLEKKINPLTLRYLILNSHYKTGINFTWKSLQGAQIALDRLYDAARKLNNQTILVTPAKAGVQSVLEKRLDSRFRGNEDEKSENNDEKQEWNQKFIDALSDDLNIPQALAVVWKMIKDKKTEEDQKLKFLLDWDNVLGLKIKENLEDKKESIKIPDKIKELLEKRKIARENKDWKESDNLRDKIKELGWNIIDTDKGQEIKE